MRALAATALAVIACSAPPAPQKTAPAPSEAAAPAPPEPAPPEPPPPEPPPEPERGIEVALPGGDSAELGPGQTRMLVSIAADGSVSIDGAAVEPGTLEAVFKAAYDRDPRTQVVIRAAANVKHGRVVELMESAKAAGLTRLAISVEP